LGERLIESFEISDLFISEKGKRVLVSVMREWLEKLPHRVMLGTHSFESTLIGEIYWKSRNLLEMQTCLSMIIIILTLLT